VLLDLSELLGSGVRHGFSLGLVESARNNITDGYAADVVLRGHELLLSARSRTQSLLSYLPVDPLELFIPPVFRHRSYESLSRQVLLDVSCQTSQLPI
jgi:hypothetical protein